MTAISEPGSPSGAGPAPVLTARPRPGEAVIKFLLVSAAVLSVLVTVGIIGAVLQPALDFFAEIPFGDFFRTSDVSDDRPYAVIPLIVGTAITTVIALCIAVPIGLGAAMYLSEYASKRARKWLKPTVELLAGVPSVVYGAFAVFFVIPVVLKQWLGLEVSAFNSLGAGLVLGVMIIPTVASLSEDALSAVPLAMRQGSLAMGANRMQTTLRVVFPAALSGIAAAIVLGMSRAVGETMIVLMAGGSIKNMSLDPTEAHETMTGKIARTALGESPVGSTEYNFLFAVALLLFVLTFIMNMFSIAIVRRFRQAY
ncbi:phosphate transport system permease protein [Nocardioides thalensis]|uniref:Phosphate transport system permease protein n=1 Tax=Nocardioides thalensis TaxID=1914755 RepID=A0A853C606_9ACTN|nr:phosphate ABC transporter permease subunit PstC [Nocardioides thalensis]NYJ02914.1 phosphate transport system permease protein [Nocardioides thalensis]